MTNPKKKISHRHKVDTIVDEVGSIKDSMPSNNGSKSQPSGKHNDKRNDWLPLWFISLLQN